MIIIQLLPVNLLQEVSLVRVQYDVSENACDVIQLPPQILDRSFNILIQRLHIIHLLVLNTTVINATFTYRYFLHLMVHVLDKRHQLVNLCCLGLDLAVFVLDLTQRQ